MTFNYDVYSSNIEDPEKRIEYISGNNASRKIKDPILITMKVELDKTQYEKILKKYKTPLGQKIAKLFGF